MDVLQKHGDMTARCLSVSLFRHWGLRAGGGGGGGGGGPGSSEGHLLTLRS